MILPSNLKLKLTPFFFLAPSLILFFLFTFGAVVFSLILSFLSWSGVAAQPQFVGISNYIRIFHDSRFWFSLQNTLVYLIVYNGIMISIAILLALLLNYPLTKLKSFFRSVYFLPVTFSLVSIALTFSIIYHLDYGIINMILNSFGFTKIGWLVDPDIALYSIILMRIWRATGYYTIILIAGLQGIPQELYDVAKVDGANSLQRTLHVTFPLWSPMILVTVVMSTIWSFQLFAEPWVLLRGGPSDATLTTAIYIYQQAFGSMRFGDASAAAFINAIIIIALTVTQIKYMARKVR
ncbi:MAG: carbohydrate ABC transporter permease [Candidatus Bathyarchaeia archaeon]